MLLYAFISVLVAPATVFEDSFPKFSFGAELQPFHKPQFLCLALNANEEASGWRVGWGPQKLGGAP